MLFPPFPDSSFRGSRTRTHSIRSTTEPDLYRHVVLHSHRNMLPPRCIIPITIYFRFFKNQPVDTFLRRFIDGQRHQPLHLRVWSLWQYVRSEKQTHLWYQLLWKRSDKQTVGIFSECDFSSNFFSRIARLKYYPVNRCMLHSTKKLLPDVCVDRCIPPK